MQAKTFIFLLAMSSFTLAGCLKNPVDMNRDIQRQLSDNNQKPRENDRSLGQGGQPGQISLNGVIVQANGLLDPRLTLVSRGGTGKDGHEVEVSDSLKPTLSHTSAAQLDYLRGLKTLLNIGCTQEFALQFAKSESLDLRALSIPSKTDYLEISAHTVVVCGDQSELNKFETTTFLADHLILNDANLSGNQKKGAITFNANRLTLMGSNVVQTKGLDSAAPISVFTEIKLNILESLDSENEGRLLIQAIGANFKSAENRKPLSSTR